MWLEPCKAGLAHSYGKLRSKVRVLYSALHEGRKKSMGNWANDLGTIDWRTNQEKEVRDQPNEATWIPGVKKTQRGVDEGGTYKQGTSPTKTCGSLELRKNPEGRV